MQVASGRDAVIVISSHVARGSVGNRAAVFALETLGFPVWAVPTVILPWHPGHGPATRITPPPEAFDAFVADLCRAPWLGEVRGVLSGYLGDAGQAQAVARLVGAVRAARPDAVYVCDPVIGDLGGLYVPEATAMAIRDHLVPIADIATPNRYELAWLAGKTLGDLDGIVEAARALAPPMVLVTSAPATEPGSIANLLVTPDATLLATHGLVERPPNGLGDLTAAVLLARILAGQAPAQALRSTMSTVYEILDRTARRGGDELQIETDAQSLSTPTARVQTRSVRRGGGAERVRPALPRCGRPVAGVDGCASGWVAVALRPGEGAAPELIVEERFEALVDRLGPEATIVVDMPIGLPARSGHGGRGPESAVRALLGMRQSSVFSIPSRAAVFAEPGPFAATQDLFDAHSRCSAVARATSEPARGVSIQAFAIFPKIREIDELLRRRPELRGRIRESHPEMAFRLLNDDMPARLPKKIKGRVNPDGMDERAGLLHDAGLPGDILHNPLPKGVGKDDLLDACAMALIADRVALGIARPYPAPPLEDEHGIEMAIWV